MPRTRLRSLTAVVLGAQAVVAGTAAAIPPPPPPPPEAALVTSSGVAWSDDGVLEAASGAVMARGLLGPTAAGRDGWIAAATDHGIVAGRFGTALSAVGSSSARGGCASWRADTRAGARGPVTLNARPTTARTAAFALAGRRLIVAGVGACRDQAPDGPRPIYARRLPDGPWRVVARVGGSDTVLAAAGHWLAVGVPHAKTMRVSVFDRDGTRLRYRLAGLTPGALSVDEHGRVLSAAVHYEPGFPVADPGLILYNTFDLTWASPAAPRAHALRLTSSVAPAFGGGRIAALEPQSDGSERLTVTDLIHGGTRAILGTRRPYRTVYALDLHASTLAIVRGDSPAAPPGSCYVIIPDGTPTLTTTDLTAAAAFDPPPPAPAPIDPAVCGPTPP